jgi:ABC-type cobalamin transport system permease subunit
VITTALVMTAGIVASFVADTEAWFFLGVIAGAAVAFVATLRFSDGLVAALVPAAIALVGGVVLALILGTVFLGVECRAFDNCIFR